MKFPKLVLAASFVAAAGGAFAETGVKLTAIDNVTNETMSHKRRSVRPGRWPMGPRRHG